MTRTITPIQRAVIMLDQSSGELREQDDSALGLDLWPETRAALDGCGAGLELILAVPPEAADRMLSEQPLEVPLTGIGEFITEQGLWQTDGTNRRPLEPRGYEHQ